MEKLLPFYNASAVEAGLDEAGRGCLAGPVFAAAVIWPRHLQSYPGIRDSKKIKPQEREELSHWIKEHCIYATAKASPEEIDQHNILQASILAMHRAVYLLDQKPEHLLVDGNRFNPLPFVSHTCVIKGDTKFLSIAAASILAKTERDRYMQKQAEKYPHYGWETNFAYPTPSHKNAIALHGPTPLHRRSFRWG